MPLNYITSLEEYNQAISQLGQPLIIYFSALWCTPCKIFATKYTRLMELYTNITFYKVDIDECCELEEYLHLTILPHFKIYNYNNILAEYSGTNEDQLHRIIESICEQHDSYGERW